METKGSPTTSREGCFFSFFGFDKTEIGRLLAEERGSEDLLGREMVVSFCFVSAIMQCTS